jgi:putative transposase
VGRWGNLADMARPVRIEVAGGWYHVTARGNERRAVFRDERDRRHFLELLEEASERFVVRWHAYVLLDNHYHLLVETRRANLSQAMQWLQVSYTVWFNRRHRRVGHLFQGRYKAVLVEAESAAWELSRYVHLNPVRVEALGLSKPAQQRWRRGISPAPDPQQVRRRLERLRTYPWSSYRAYARLAKSPGWLVTEAVLAMGGGRSRAERVQTYRQYVEEAVREGLAASPWERLEGQLLLGGAEFVRQMRRRVKGDAREQPQLKRLHERRSFQEIVKAVEEDKGEKWATFRDRHGDWGRDVVLYLARRHGGMRLRELAQQAGAIDYGSVQMAVRRIGERQERDKSLRATVNRLKAQLFYVET